LGCDGARNKGAPLVADANLFVEQGCNCSISTNNVLNPFTPFGDCSLIRMANLHANILQVGQNERLARSRTDRQGS
jgi:cytosine deaminase